MLLYEMVVYENSYIYIILQLKRSSFISVLSLADPKEHVMGQCESRVGTCMQFQSLITLLSSGFLRGLENFRNISED